MNRVMKILLATSNPHKLQEIQAVWDELAQPGSAPQIQLVGLGEVGPPIPEPVEDGPTFEDNAVLKARYYAVATGWPCLADDSGLEVDALGGQLRVHSARYSGAVGPRAVVDAANNALLLEKLRDVPPEKRTARFVCAMALCLPPDTLPEAPKNQIRLSALVSVRGTVEGRIIDPGQAPRGRNGFGYDPLFELPHLGKTTAELSPQEKNALSHRGQAARKMWHAIMNLPRGSFEGTHPAR